MPTPTDLSGAVVAFEPRLLPSAAYYARMAMAPRVLIDTTLRYDRRNKGVHRTTVADTRGALQLTVPVAKGDRRPAQWRDVAVSDHGRWWDSFRVTLESAYGRTPFFEFYIDDFLPFLTEEYATSAPGIIDMDVVLDAIVRRILLIDADVAYSPADCAGSEIIRSTSLPEPVMKPYWQVRTDKFGFIPSMSVVDLIFNLGPEAALYLRESAGGI